MSLVSTERAYVAFVTLRRVLEQLSREYSSPNNRCHLNSTRSYGVEKRNAHLDTCALKTRRFRNSPDRRVDRELELSQEESCDLLKLCNVIFFFCEEERWRLVSGLDTFGALCDTRL